jgi:hypothetical protein
MVKLALRTQIVTADVTMGDAVVTHLREVILSAWVNPVILRKNVPMTTVIKEFALIIMML